MKTKLTVHVVLDRSGSMDSCKKETIKGFNDYVSKLAADAPDSRLSLTIFDSESVDTIIDNVPIGEVQPLDGHTYQPRGGTPLYDAVGKCVGLLDRAEGEHKAMVILTDGEENASREYTAKMVLDLLADMQKDNGWLVIYLGANQDAFKEGAKFGTQRGSTMTYNTAYMAQTMGSAAASTARYASSGGDLKAAEFTDEEREASK